MLREGWPVFLFEGVGSATGGACGSASPLPGHRQQHFRIPASHRSTTQSSLPICPQSWGQCCLVCRSPEVCFYSSKSVKGLFSPCLGLLNSQPWPRPTRERWDLSQRACSPFSGCFELLFALVSWQDPGKMQHLFSLVGALFQRIALAVFPPTYATNQPLRIHHFFQDKQEESMEEIRIGLFFLTTFIAEVWEKKGSSSET